MIRITTFKVPLIAVFVLALFSFLCLGPYRETSGHLASKATLWKSRDPPNPALLKGHAIAPKLGNATAKAELGRAAWKVLHTTFGRFPEKPTEEEQEALRSYVYLFQRLYPCGDCAEHFGQVLAKYPPQVSSRTAAAMWGCYVHNIVNKRLKKPEFDCKNIGDAYDCGCGEDEPEASAQSPAA
ncbi:hypothetical protein IAQ61_001825 [Plenodomus lingam]|uniref:Sulfhydryl oxidase n=1 Tax=Leptosphaeria maculans (strain JN3 / isolate v23.1.3 / race Av1-4-5-6-7-8) TaxID=985895 RepID=E4ZGA9_LEPMJ|nr:similar to FAD-linked sulfhydryl oxidase ERV2 [Plenodomus lingam JN3]KAH9878553.1 hypothetical protein IAQ61_001825 [Plenodomus lingam]CBX90329.1 similar to FAD-linked sulfhydryl oxidase ERV2 [Plenodomus lingam JN3]